MPSCSWYHSAASPLQANRGVRFIAIWMDVRPCDNFIAFMYTDQTTKIGLHNQAKYSLSQGLRYQAVFWVGFLFSVGISIATLWYHNDIGASIAVFAVLYFAQFAGSIGTISMRMS